VMALVHSTNWNITLQSSSLRTVDEYEAQKT